MLLLPMEKKLQAESKIASQTSGLTWYIVLLKHDIFQLPSLPCYTPFKKPSVIFVCLYLFCSDPCLVNEYK